MTVATGPRLSPIDVVITRLAKRTGREPSAARESGTWTADCPIGHVGADDALHVQVAKDARVLLSCQFGCKATAIAGALGLTATELFHGAENGAAPGETSTDLPVAIRAIDAPEPEPFTWCVEDLLIAGELGVLAGDGGSYKSTGAFHLAAAVAGGYSAFSRFPTQQRPALILSAEDGAGIVLNRLEAIVAGHGWDRERVLTNVHLIATHDAKLANPAWQQHLLAECARLEVGFVLFDPWADLISGEENSNSEQRPIIQFCRRVATQTNAAVLVNAHAAKVREGQRTIDRIRGATALRDAARCVLFFESRPEGIAVEHIKMSRSERLLPFTLTREIESSPESRAVWTTARFSFLSTDEAILSRAETFVLDQVTAFPGALKSADLRSRGAAAGINYEGIAKAMTRLQARGLLDYAEGARNAKLWTAVAPLGSSSGPSSEPAQPNLGRLGRQKSEPAQPAQSALGRLEATTSELTEPALPYREGGRLGVAGRSGQAGQAQLDDELEAVDIPEEFDR